jgi:hypothetical protein
MHKLKATICLAALICALICIVFNRGDFGVEFISFALFALMTA